MRAADWIAGGEPNRISSSGYGGSDWFRLDQRARSILRVRHRTALNCNPNCNLLTRRYPCALPDSFSSVRDLGFVPARRSCRSGEPDGRSSAWLPAWLPAVHQVRHHRPGARHRQRAISLRCGHALSCSDPSPEPDCCRTTRQTGSVQGRRSRSRSDARGALDRFWLT